MFGSQHILTRMAALVTVGDVCGEILTTFDSDTKIPDAANIWQDACLDRVPSDPLAYVSLVSKEGKVVGWLDFSDLVAEPDRAEAIESCMMHIKVGSLVTADTPLLAAMKMFDAQSPYCFLVMKGNAIVGAFSYQDLLSIPFRSCLFSMLLSIEQGMRDIAQTSPDLAVSKLKCKGTKVAKRIKRRAATNQPFRASEILEHAYFSEVLHVLRSCSKTNRRLTSLNASYTKQRRMHRLKAGVPITHVKRERRHRVDQALDLRNALAHPNKPWRISLLLPKEDLKAFISWLTEFEAELAEYVALGNKLED